MTGTTIRTLLAATAVMALGSTAAPAQTTTPPSGTAPAAGTAAPAPATNGAGSAAPVSKAAEAHVARLHKLLGITPAEEPQWSSFAAVLRSTGADRDAAVEGNKAAIPNQTAPEIMKGYADLMARQAQDLQQVGTAFETLYASLSPVQQKQADAAFRQNGMRRAERQQQPR